MSSLFFLPALIRPFLAVFAITLSVSLAGCASGLKVTKLKTRLDAWLPTDVLLLGEQHDAPGHQALQQQIVEALAARGFLAAVALEMADSGNSTATLTPDASEEQTRIATILSDMDSEISTLETKLSKAQSIKHGMMQQLLTGKIRLI